MMLSGKSRRGSIRAGRCGRSFSQDETFISCFAQANGHPGWSDLADATSTFRDPGAVGIQRVNEDPRKSVELPRRGDPSARDGVVRRSDPAARSDRRVSSGDPQNRRE